MATDTASPVDYLADFITDSVATAGAGDDDVRALSVPTIPITQFKIAYKPDPGVSGYWTQKGEPRVLDVVKKAEGVLANHSFLNLSPPDLSEFNKLTAELVIGADSFSVRGGRTATVQCLSGAGSLRVGAEFLATYYPVPTIYIPQQTWGNHKKIFRFAGLTVKTYRYYDPQTRGLHFEGMMEDLGSATRGSVVLLHACAQGVDPTLDQWNQIKKLIRGNGLLPFFDISYQGLASGRLDVDAYSVRMFVEDGDECLVAQSYAENMCLYAERVGAFSIVCPCEKVAGKVEGQLKLVIGHMNYNLHGAYVVSTILKDSGMFKDWTVELQAMADGIVSMRQIFVAALSARGTPGDWSHITKQTGMFTFTGLSPKQAAFVAKKYHIFMTTHGQISMAGLNSNTLPQLVDAIHEAVTRIN